MSLRRILPWSGLLLCLVSVWAAAADTARGLLWEVRSDRATVYLVGTIHVGNASLYPLPPAIEDAYRAASVLALEADVTNQESLAAAASSVYRPPDSLERHVPPALFRDLVDVLRTYGLPMEVAKAMKPPMLSMALTMFEVSRIGMDARLGIDLHLAQRARQDGKPIVELESVAMQMEMLERMSPEAQVAMLEATVAGIRSGSLPRDMAALVEAWKRGDADAVDAIAMADLRKMPPAAAESLQKNLYDDRNLGMTEKIVAMLNRAGVALVAVGAGHMTGPTGLVAALQSRGFTVRQH